MESSGIVIIDKPAGISSAKVVALLKKKVGLRKVGHAGTLDPFATGVLICCVNQATRLARFFLHGKKTYQGSLVLGTETDTLDATGEIISTRDYSDVSVAEAEAVIQRLEGVIDQVPPVYSALKHNGVPLYKLARKGTPVQKPARQVTIFSIRVLKIDLPTIEFQVTCSAGTYIRTLCADIGRALGCGAHLAGLRRLESGGFSVDQAVSLEDLEIASSQGHQKDFLIGMSPALGAMQAVVADARISKKIQYGQPILRSEMPDKEIGLKSAHRFKGFLKIVDEQDNLLAVMDTQKNNGAYDYCCVFHPPAP